jgi:hypothetical protein
MFFRRKQEVKEPAFPKKKLEQLLDYAVYQKMQLDAISNYYRARIYSGSLSRANSKKITTPLYFARRRYYEFAQELGEVMAQEKALTWATVGYQHSPFLTEATLKALANNLEVDTIIAIFENREVPQLREMPSIVEKYANTVWGEQWP